MSLGFVESQESQETGESGGPMEVRRGVSRADSRVDSRADSDSKVVAESEALRQQTTLSAGVVLDGRGIHSGKPCRLEIQPAETNFGYRYCRTDLNSGLKIKISPMLAEEKDLQTRIVADGVAIATPEHVLSACAGLGLDNLLFLLDAEEAPIFDGSAREIVERILAQGVVEQSAPRYAVRVLRDVVLEDEEGQSRVVFRPLPLPLTEIAVEMESPLAAIGYESLEMRLTRENYIRELAPARTYGERESRIPLLKRKLGMGASLKNTIVLARGQVVSGQDLRFADEFVRHKALDLVGDLALLNAPLWGRVEAYAPSHRFTGRALRTLLDEAEAWEKVPFPEPS